MKYVLQNAAVWLAALGLVAIAAPACSSSTSPTSSGTGPSDPSPSSGNASTNPGTGTTTTPLTLEAKLATAKCSQFVRCAPVAFGRTYKDQADCVTQKTPSYVNELHATSAAVSDAQMSDCVTKLGAASCDDYSTTRTCLFTGTLATGTACTHDTQCTSGVCFAATDTGCGSCADVAAIGADCSASACATGSYCNGNTSKCTAYGDQGATCGPGTFCKAILTCTPGAGNTRTCKTPLQVGGDCTFGTGGACADGLDCVNDKCVAETKVAVGAKCGYDASGEHYTDCTDAQCAGLDQNFANGTCTAWPTVGAACDDDNTCIDDLLCTAGKCAYAFDRLVCN